MGREVKRVPLDFNFPLDKSYSDVRYEQHRATCTLDEDSCADEHFSEIHRPPTGEGWQLWQTVSDGPISPVFKTADELIDWMCKPETRKRPWDSGLNPYPAMPWAQGWRREVAEPFVRSEGWAPSMVIDHKGLRPGADAVAEAVVEEARGAITRETPISPEDKKQLTVRTDVLKKK